MARQFWTSCSCQCIGWRNKCENFSIHTEFYAQPRSTFREIRDDKRWNNLCETYIGNCYSSTNKCRHSLNRVCTSRRSHHIIYVAMTVFINRTVEHVRPMKQKIQMSFWRNVNICFESERLIGCRVGSSSLTSEALLTFYLINARFLLWKNTEMKAAIWFS